MLGQNEIGKLLKQCNSDPVAIEEVLSAYVVWKYLKGRPPGHILAKLRYPSGQHDTLRASGRAFAVVTTECELGSDSRIGMAPATTQVGKEVWNRIRRHMSSSQLKLMTDGMHSGPAPIQAFMTTAQRTPAPLPAITERPQWAEVHFQARNQFGNEGSLPRYADVPCGRGGEGVLLPAYEPRASGDFDSISMRSAPDVVR
ncbi:hypothetical protein HWV62_1084 [Athelia sp. TMB]|nr:hypothetical protein HWV62_1084 [Athelia sp. TMB]